MNVLSDEMMADADDLRGALLRGAVGDWIDARRDREEEVRIPVEVVSFIWSEESKHIGLTREFVSSADARKVVERTIEDGALARWPRLLPDDGDGWLSASQSDRDADAFRDAIREFVVSTLMVRLTERAYASGESGEAWAA
jgi:hypothetical protein